MGCHIHSGTGGALVEEEMKSVKPVLHQARQLTESKLSIIPIRDDGTKAPALSSWKHYQTKIAAPKTLNKWFANGNGGVAVICGQVSGNLEVIDFDDPAAFERWKRLVGELGGADLLKMLVIVETPTGGFHVYYRCSDGVEGNKKLAQGKDSGGKLKVLIETRGEGGYVIAPGSPKTCHPLKKCYKRLKGQLTEIPTITGEERELLLSAARALNEHIEPKRLILGNSDASGNRPGDNFNARASWEEILEPHDWEKAGERDEVTDWRRPGKGIGISATTNHAGMDLFYNFSTNGHPFKAETGYTKFAAYTLLNHDGDFSAAAAELAVKGYGTICLGCSSEEFLELQIPPKEPLVKGLLHGRDLVTLAGRRRHGKTTFLINLCVALALGIDFLGYKTPEPRRSLMLLLEDDPGELQEKFARVTKGKDIQGRIRIVTREDFYEAKIPIDITKPGFRKAVRTMAADHDTELIVVDNIAHVIGAKYNDPELIHLLMVEVYQWAKIFDCAVILAAHPRKEDMKKPVRLDQQPESFFETVMGSSHFVNSTGSLWGLQRCDSEGYSVFLGGRQRGDGQQGFTLIEKGDDDWLIVLPDLIRSFDLVVNTPVRKEAWKLLPSHPQTFSYTEGEAMVKPVMRSSSTYHRWMTDLRRHKLVLEVNDQLQKAGIGQ